MKNSNTETNTFVGKCQLQVFYQVHNVVEQKLHFQKQLKHIKKIWKIKEMCHLHSLIIVVSLVEAKVKYKMPEIRLNFVKVTSISIILNSTLASRKLESQYLSILSNKMQTCIFWQA